MRTVEWTIGPEWGGHDCETCWAAYELLEVSITNGRSIDAQASWGCHSGDSIYNADVAELHLFLDRLPTGFANSAALERLLEEVDAEMSDK